MKRRIFSTELSEKYKKEKKDFTRQRLLPFGYVIILIMSGHKFSLQNALNKFYNALGKLLHVPTGSAYCQSKQKVKAEVFQYLNESVVEDFYRLYSQEDKVKLWHGHRVLGSDGTYLNLPDSMELRKAFSVQRNQHKDAKSEQVQALAMVLYDLLNDIGIRGALGPSHTSEKSLLFDELWADLRAGDLLVLDRNSADYAIIAQAVKP